MVRGQRAGQHERRRHADGLPDRQRERYREHDALHDRGVAPARALPPAKRGNGQARDFRQQHGGNERMLELLSQVRAVSFAVVRTALEAAMNPAPRSANDEGLLDVALALAAARAFPGLAGMDLAKVVSTERAYEWNDGVWKLGEGYPKAAAGTWHVVAYDYGVKHNILRLLADRGCRVTVVPAQTSAAQALALNPDGLFLSNGPGDPEPCDYAISAIRTGRSGWSAKYNRAFKA